MAVMINEWFHEAKNRGYPFPDSYLVFDLETTGLDILNDYIIQIGIMNVIAGKIIDSCTTLLDWSKCRSVDLCDVTDQMHNTMQRMKALGKHYDFSMQKLKSEGRNAIEVIEKYYTFFNKCKQDNVYFLTHNGFHFDTLMLQNHFRRFLDINFEFDTDYLLDTGLLEKGSQLGFGHLPFSRTELHRFYNMVYRAKRQDKKQIPWSLDNHCIPKYELLERYDLDLSQMHTAAYDCKVTHLLFQEFIRQSEAGAACIT